MKMHSTTPSHDTAAGPKAATKKPTNPYLNPSSTTPLHDTAPGLEGTTKKPINPYLKTPTKKPTNPYLKTQRSRTPSPGDLHPKEQVVEIGVDDDAHRPPLL
jgi:hypothetical protein